MIKLFDGGNFEHFEPDFEPQQSSGVGGLNQKT